MSTRLHPHMMVAQLCERMPETYLARYIGLDRVTVNAWHRGLREPQDSPRIDAAVERLCEAYALVFGSFARDATGERWAS